MTLNDVLTTFGRRDVLLIVGLGLLSVLLWQVPIVNWLFIPFRVLNTFIHELCHIVAARVTGGKFQRFRLRLTGGGFTPVLGGTTCLVASAGYLGAALFGGLLILLTAANIPSRTALLGLGVLVGLLCFLFVGNCFGVAVSLVLAGVLYLAGWYLDEPTAATVLLFLATQMILASFKSLSIQLQISRQARAGQNPSDAEIMEDVTAIPAVIWALLWCAVAIGILLWSVTVAYRDLPLR
ncbi:MAG: M50 family metallopeptidase [Roseiflexaceae bacterium]